MKDDRFKYTLTKLSDPGFILQTMHEKTVLDTLERYTCRECFVDIASGGGRLVTDGERISDILDSTLCGLEFMLEVEDE